MATASQLTCLCRLVQEPATLLADQTLPNESNICHCDTCRHTTGSLGAWYLTLKESPSAKSLTHTTPYKTSEKFTRFFCRQCGCNVFVRSEDGTWLACAGILEIEKDDKGQGHEQTNISKVLYHEYVADAKDGGIAPFLTKLGERIVPSYTTKPGEDGAKPLKETELQQLQELSLSQLPPAVQERGDMLKVSCHCGACQLRISPPAYDDSSEGWHVPRGDRNKYYARLCCCRSCRLTLGFPLQPWTYVPAEQIFTVNKEPVVFGVMAKDTVQIKKLKHYQSSEFVLRSFCTGCGATMFYQSFDRPQFIDVSVGVLRSQAGNVLAGEWLEWDRAEVSKKDEAVEEELVEAWLRK